MEKRAGTAQAQLKRRRDKGRRSLEWWGWVFLGFALLAVEILAAGNFFVFFFGIGALLVGLLAGLGVAGPPWLHWILFTALSLVTMFTLRSRLLSSTTTPMARADRDDFMGQTALVKEDFFPNGAGKVEMRGTIWNARNVGSQPLHRGDRCMVHRVDGLTLEVRRED